VSTSHVERYTTLPPDGVSWLEPVRRAALERFRTLGFPTPKNEDWHFTNAAPIAESTFEPMAASRGVSAHDIAPFLVGHQEWPTMVFVNGRYATALSRAALPDGIRLMSLASAIREEPTLVERHLSRIASVDEHAFTALNTAHFQDGAVIHVGRGVELDTPIHLLFVTDAGSNGGVTHPRILVVVEPQAKATLIEQYATLGDARYFTNVVAEVVVGDGATLDHYRLQRESRNAFHVGTVETKQGRDSHYHSFSFATGGSLVRTNIYASLAGEGCGATLNGLYMLDGDQHCDHQTRIEHAQPNCYSREVYKGILDDESHGVFNGKVYVHAIAQKTDGKQTNNTLLLSERARVDTKPQLEIFADDVKCTHGATIGRIDEIALFYMKSRGIAKETARKLLMYAFAAEVLETIELEPLKDELERLTLARFTGE
jgi:Fe-S cluster assembly protein SufD